MTSLCWSHSCYWQLRHHCAWTPPLTWFTWQINCSLIRGSWTHMELKGTLTSIFSINHCGYTLEFIQKFELLYLLRGWGGNTKMHSFQSQIQVIMYEEQKFCIADKVGGNPSVKPLPHHHHTKPYEICNFQNSGALQSFGVHSFWPIWIWILQLKIGSDCWPAGT